jgi:hypothetical protein
MILEEVISVTPLELIAGMGYLLGHFFLSRKNKFGWIVKMMGGIAWIVFLFQNNNLIFASVTIVVVMTMIYGFYKWQRFGRDAGRTRIDIFFEYLAVIVAIIMIARVLTLGLYNLSSVFESLIVVVEILGTVMLAYKKIIGWYLYIVMSSLAGILVVFINPNPAIVLGLLEVCSIYFYYKGIRNFQKSF